MTIFIYILLTIVGIAVIALFIWFFQTDKKFKAKIEARENAFIKTIIEHGIHASATILSVKSSPVNRIFMDFYLQLQINTENGESYELSQPSPVLKSLTISLTDIHRIQKGATLPIRIHPDEPDRILFEFELDKYNNL